MFILPSLDSIVPESIPYVVRGAILRFVRTIVSWAASTAIVVVSSNTLFQQLHLPVEYQVLASGILTPALVAVDKYLREKGYEETEAP